MSKTKIEWVARPGTTPESWNPITGCTKISAGCTNCYAERMARRLAGRYGYPESPRHFDVTPHLDRLDEPLKRKKPTTYFVCSMGDLFHGKVANDWRCAIWCTMEAAKQHTFLILTKRANHMLDWTKWVVNGRDPLPNVWLGVTAENQATADERIPLLLQTPAAVRFVSCEPLLEAIDISPYMPHPSRKSLDWDRIPGRGEAFTYPFTGISWAIVGGESGPGARPMMTNWARDLMLQCKAAGVPIFVKQMGTWAARFAKYKSRKGADPSEWPEDLIVREFPK